MERSLKTTAEVLEILLNFTLVLGAETVADAAFGGLSAPMYGLFIPLAAPLLFYAARKHTKNLLLFLAVHAAVIAALNYAGGFLPVPLLWKTAFTAVGVVYAVMSLKIRLTCREDGEGEASVSFMAIAAIALFFGGSRLGGDAACARILWLALLWLPGHWIKDYLENFLNYMKMNRRAAGAMPEKRIFRGGVLLVAGYSGFCLAVLALYAKTALVARLSGLVRKAGLLLVRLLLRLLLLFHGSGEEEAAVTAAEGGADPMMFLPAAEEAPLWMQILDKILVAAVTVLIIAGLIAAVVMLIRYVIQSFYGREKEKKEIRQEGFVEEEERLEKKKDGGSRRVPKIGGTPVQRVRRCFKRAVQDALKQNGGRDSAPEWKRHGLLSAAGEGTLGAAGTAAGEKSFGTAGTALRENPFGTAGTVTGEGPLGLTADACGTRTARELAKLCGSVCGQEKADWEALTALYETARYTQRAVTKEDVREAERLAGKLRRQKRREGM